jgi:hypothetical protein
MAYYDALIAKWATLAPGTTQAKLDAINALTVTGQIPSSFFITGAQLFNCLDWTEFAALTTAQQTTLLQICAISGPIKGGTGSFFAGLVPVFYAGKLGGPTVTAMTALAQAAIQPWWQATVAQGGGGLSSPVSNNDLLAAGGLT